MKLDNDMQLRNIEKIITRFFFKGDEALYSIFLKYKNGETKEFKTYSDYILYKNKFDELIKAQQKTMA